ncbi:MAG: APC family permease [Acidobacteria bacterium]|nr:MAG: APC family permease [Acidobacteriota bacterium]
MTDEKLVRGLGRWDLTALVINGIIGAGIFGLPAKVYAQIGSYSLFAFAACAVIIGLIVLCYAEVSSRFSATGGSYLYAKEAFGPAIGFEVGWLYWIVRIATFAANCNLLITYLGFFIPGANEGWKRAAFATLVVLIITIVNLVGVRESARMTNIMTFGKLLPLVAFILVGIFFIQPGNFTFDAAPQYSSFSSAVLLLIYAFVGFEAAAVVSGETRDPERTIPFGLLVGILIVTLFYIAIQIVSIGTLPGLATSERPIADAASGFLGRYGAAFISLGVIVSILGNLNTGVLSATRTLFAMSEQRELPRIFEWTHPRFKTPYVSIIATTLVMLGLTIYSSFLTAVAIATITRLLFYATTCLALPIFRRRTDLPPAQFSAPFGVVAAVLSLILIVWLLTNVDFSKEGLPIVIFATIGFIVYAAYSLWESARRLSKT